jgi:hypothetical protein
MATGTATRRPLPALIALLALLILTALVWWRVLHRGGSSHNAAPPPTCPTHTSAPPSTPELPAPESVTVRVLNSTNRAGIAGEAQAALVKDGFRSPAPAANDVKHHNKIKGVAQIRYRPDEKSAATLVSYYFPGAVLVPTKSKHPVVTISLGKHYRHVASPQQVSAAMRAAGVGASTSPGGGVSSSARC